MSMRTKSAVWEYFLRCPNGEDKMICRICNSILSGRNASNAKKHLRYSHQDEFNQVNGYDLANISRKRPVDNQALESSFMASIESLTNNIEPAIREPKFTIQERDLLIWLSKPTITLCTLITDDCKRFIRNFDKNFDLPNRKNHVVNMMFRCARHLQYLIDCHIKNTLSKFAVSVDIWQVNNVMLICVSLNFIDNQFHSKRVFLGSSLLRPNQSMKRIKSKVLDILHNYNINDTQISSYITNGPPEFMSAFKRDYDETSSILNEDDFVTSCSVLGNFSDENDDLSMNDNNTESRIDVFADFSNAQQEMKEVFGSKHVFSLELQIEYVMSRVEIDEATSEVLFLVETFRKDPDFVSRLSTHCTRPMMVSLKPNWRCRFFSAKRILEIHPFINQVAQEKLLPIIREDQVQQMSNYIELLEPFINLICSAQPEKAFSELYGLVQSLIFHCAKMMEKDNPIREKANAIRNQLQSTFSDVLTVNSDGVINYIGAALLNPNQAYLVDMNRKTQIACISSIYEAYKRPFFVKQEGSSSSNGTIVENNERIDTFEEFMLKKRRIEENSRRDAMQNERTKLSSNQMAEFYLNLVSTRPSNLNTLEFWKNATVDLDPLKPLALDFAAIPSSVSIYEFFSSLGLLPNPSNSELQLFSCRLMISLNKHILLE